MTLYSFRKNRKLSVTILGIICLRKRKRKVKCTHAECRFLLFRGEESATMTRCWSYSCPPPPPYLTLHNLPLLNLLHLNLHSPPPPTILILFSFQSSEVPSFTPTLEQITRTLYPPCPWNPILWTYLKVSWASRQHIRRQQKPAWDIVFTELDLQLRESLDKLWHIVHKWEIMTPTEESRVIVGKIDIDC